MVRSSQTLLPLALHFFLFQLPCQLLPLPITHTTRTRTETAAHHSGRGQRSGWLPGRRAGQTGSLRSATAAQHARVKPHCCWAVDVGFWGSGKARATAKAGQWTKLHNVGPRPCGAFHSKLHMGRCRLSRGRRQWAHPAAPHSCCHFHSGLLAPRRSASSSPRIPPPFCTSMQPVIYLTPPHMPFPELNPPPLHSRTCVRQRLVHLVCAELPAAVLVKVVEGVLHKATKPRSQQGSGASEEGALGG